MNFDWNEYLYLAKELSGDKDYLSNKEARERSAISRAYYSAIIQARAKVCLINGEKFPRKNTHAWTIGKFISHANPQAKSIGSRLKRLKKRRERADYDDHIRNRESELRSALLEAEKLIDEINEFS